MSIRVYLDTSVYNRPFDDQSQPRIWLETLAFSVILQMIENEAISLVASSAVAYENSRNPHQLRQEWVDKVLNLAGDYQLVDETIHNRAQEMAQEGIKPLDALHLACAEIAGVEYFISVDDRLLKRYQRFEQRVESLVVCNPTEFIRIIGGTLS